jgi:site-specific recombinase XerD
VLPGGRAPRPCLVNRQIHSAHVPAPRATPRGAPFVFTSERGAPFTTAGFAKLTERAGAAAKLPFKAHPHMLRHACGYALANKGHDTRAIQGWLGHRNIQHTVRYTELARIIQPIDAPFAQTGVLA